MEIVIHTGKNDVMIRGGYMCFELCEQRTRRGKTEWEACLWFVDLASVFNELLKRRVRNSDARTLLELKEVIKTAQAELLEAWNLNKFDVLMPKILRSSVK
jgi:hypothetical protein